MNSLPCPFLIRGTYLTPLPLLTFALSTHTQLVFWGREIETKRRSYRKESDESFLISMSRTEQYLASLVSLANPISAYAVALSCPCVLGRCFVRAARQLAKSPLPGHFPLALGWKMTTIKE